MELSSETGLLFIRPVFFIGDLNGTNFGKSYQPIIFRPIGVDLDEKSDRNNKRVLVIDDDPDTIDLLKRILLIAEFDVASAQNGYDGSSIAKKIVPDAILLDLMMPEIDGQQTLIKIKEVTNAPVIILSALTNKEIVVDLLNHGI